MSPPVFTRGSSATASDRVPNRFRFVSYQEPCWSVRWNDTGIGPPPTGSPPEPVVVVGPGGWGLVVDVVVGTAVVVVGPVVVVVGPVVVVGGAPPTTTDPSMSGWKRQW